jgi:hypothetical protein
MLVLDSGEGKTEVAGRSGRFIACRPDPPRCVNQARPTADSVGQVTRHEEIVRASESLAAPPPGAHVVRSLVIAVVMLTVP